MLTIYEVSIIFCFIYLLCVNIDYIFDSIAIGGSI